MTVNRTIAAIFLVLASGVAFALDPLAYNSTTMPDTDEGNLAYTLRFYGGELWMYCLDEHVKVFGNEKVGERIVTFVDGAFDVGRVSPVDSPEYQLCSSGFQALGYIKATNSLPFVKWAALHSGEKLRNVTFRACREIMGYSDEYIDFLDRALREGAITREYHATEMTGFIWGLNHGEIKATQTLKLKVTIRLMKNPYGYYREGSGNDDFIMAVFPPYSNSVERITALTAMLENQLTPPEGHAKYEPERDRLRALPPESLVHAADELQAELDALLKAAERKRKIEQVKKYAVPAGIAVLVLAVLAVLFRKRFR